MTLAPSLSQAIRSLELPDANLLAALCVMEPGVWQTATEVADQFCLNHHATRPLLGKLVRRGFAEKRGDLPGLPSRTYAYAATEFGRQVNQQARRGPSRTAALGAAVASTMWEAGLDSGAMAWWWRRSRSELDGYSPREMLHRHQPSVLELAREDAERLREETHRIAHEQSDQASEPEPGLYGFALRLRGDE